MSHKARIAFFDIEASNLSADFGHTLSFAGKALGDKKVFAKTILQFPQKDIIDDRGLVIAARDWLAEADIWVSWYGSRYDVPFLNSRLIHWNEQVLPPIPHVDLWRVSRYRLHIHSNRLESAAMFLGVNSKTKLDGNVWVRASVGDPKAMRYILKHNIEDVFTLERAYRKMRSLVPVHPNVTLTAEADGIRRCPTCGSDQLQKRGYSIAQSRKYPRFACKGCGSWSRGKAESSGG